MFKNNQSHTMEEGRYFEKGDPDSSKASRQTSMMGQMKVRVDQNLHDRDNGADAVQQDPVEQFDLASEEPKRKYCSKNLMIAMIGFTSILIAIIITIVIIGSNSSWWASSPSEDSPKSLQLELVPSFFLSH